MIKYVLCFSLIFISFSVTFSQRTLIELNKKVNQTINEYTSNGFPDTPGELTEFDTELEKYLNELRAFKKNSKKNPLYKYENRKGKRQRYNYSIMYIGAKLMNYYIETQSILTYKDLSWEKREEKDNLKEFQQKFIDLIKRAYYEPDINKADNEFKRESLTMEKLLEIPKKSYNNMVFKNSVWSVMNELGQKIQEAEMNIYQITTMDKTSKQYQYVYQNYLKNQFTQDAFNNYYRLFTADGEMISQRDFEQQFTSGNEYEKYFKTITQETFFKEDRSIANATELLLKRKKPLPSREELIKAMKEAYPKETAFVILQKLIKQDLGPNMNFCKAQETLKENAPIFEDKYPLYKKTYNKYLHLKADLDWLSKLKKRPSIEKFTLVNTEQHDTRIIFSPNSNNFYVQGNGLGNDNAKEYERKNDQWILKEEHIPRFNTFYRYLPEAINLTQDRKEKYIDATSGKDFSLNADFILDMQFFSRNINGEVYDFIFFVSRSDNYRTEIDESEIKNKEYNSPGNNNKNNDLKTRDLQSSVYFHGEQEGNTNTDIYYSIRKRGSTWGRFYNMGNIVNTPFSERTPVLSADGQSLYFSSEGHGGLGGLDMYRVNIRIIPNRFQIEIADPLLENMIQFNSTSDDLAFTPALNKNINEVYFSSNRDGNFDFYYWDGNKKYDVPSTSTGIIIDKEPAQETTDSIVQIAGRVTSCGTPTVKITANGKDYSNLYDPSTGKIEGNIPLNDGKNGILIEAQDGTEKDKKIISVIKKKEDTGSEVPLTPDNEDNIGKSPIITFIKPLKKEDLFFKENITIKAKILNIESGEDIRFKHNEQLITDFFYDKKTKIFNYHIDKTDVVKNKIEIFARNKFDSTVVEKEIYCQSLLPTKHCQENPLECARYVKVDAIRSSSNSDKTQIKGSVSDIKNQPVTVNIDFISEDQKVDSTTSDAEGNYIKFLSHKKRYAVKVFDEGIAYQNYFYLPAVEGGFFVFDIKGSDPCDTITLKEAFFFDHDKDLINNKHKIDLVISRFIKKLSQDKDYKLVVYGYADITGDPCYNCCLSRRRAQSVKNYLVFKGLDASKIEIRGVGESSFFNEDQQRLSFPRSIDTYSDEDKELQANRRVSIKIQAIDSCPVEEISSAKFPEKDCLEIMRSCQCNN